MYNQTLHRVRKRFCRYCLQFFSTAQILKKDLHHCFEINGKQIMKMAKRDETVKFKNHTRKIKSPCVIYADFESILTPENNSKKDPDQSYTNIYQNHVECSFR